MEEDITGELVIDYQNSGHEIKVYRVNKPVEVIKGGGTLVRTLDAMILYESNHNPVYYIPIKDVPEENLVATDTKTFCPYKGTANYYSLRKGEETSKDAVWQYLDANREFEAIRNYVAFYPNSIDNIKIV